MPILCGVYRCRYQRAPYSYEVSWRAAGDRAVWEATVRLNGSLVGAPNGEVTDASAEGVEVAVRRVIEISIDPYSM